jgi:hypothetical protein
VSRYQAYQQGCARLPYRAYLAHAHACMARARAASDRPSKALWLAVARNWIDAAGLARTVSRLHPVR